jgi:hypothetical protein
MAMLCCVVEDRWHPWDWLVVEASQERAAPPGRPTQQGALHQRRIKDLVRKLMSASPLTGELTKTDLAVLARWPDPRALLAAGRTRLTTLITKTSHGQQGTDRAEQWRQAARGAVALYADHPAMPWSELAAELATEVRLLAAVRASSPSTPPPGPRPTGSPTRRSARRGCPGWPRSAPPPSPRSSAAPPGSAPAGSSAASPG